MSETLRLCCSYRIWVLKELQLLNNDKKRNNIKGGYMPALAKRAACSGPQHLQACSHLLACRLRLALLWAARDPLLAPSLRHRRHLVLQ